MHFIPITALATFLVSAIAIPVTVIDHPDDKIPTITSPLDFLTKDCSTTPNSKTECKPRKFKKGTLNINEKRGMDDDADIMITAAQPINKREHHESHVDKVDTKKIELDPCKIRLLKTNELIHRLFRRKKCEPDTLIAPDDMRVPIVKHVEKRDEKAKTEKIKQLKKMGCNKNAAGGVSKRNCLELLDIGD